MKKFKAIGISVLIAACAVCLSLAFVACKGGEKSASYGAGEEGFYYYDGANSARYMLSLQSGNYMITANNETQYSGSYSYNEETGEISFSGDAAFTATMGENAISLDMGDSGYSFKAYKYFDVTYVDENGNTVATESVLNGQSVEAITVEKDGYYFIGWYEDSSNSSEFAFNTSIAGDTTVYGWYIEKNLTATEYEITLDYGDGTVEYVSTMNGAVWTLPTDGILGWWVSATNKSGELTYKYNTGDLFTADTTLFAVSSGIGASVTSEGITWDSSRAGANVAITITDENGETVLTANPSSSSGSYTSTDFAGLGAGTYTVTVGTDTLTYVVNGLSRVSKSSMEIVTNGEGRVLSFAPVENASGYTITINDGTKTVTEDLGSRTYYNLSSWEMTETGLTITVTAYAGGYVSSVSEAYNYLLKLDSVVIEMSGDDFSWNRVENSLEYEVVIYAGDGVTVLESFYTTDTSYSLKYYDAGTYTISVKPVTDGYWSKETTIDGQAKSTIAAPVITDVTNYTVTWTAVTDAASYVVMINGTEYSVTDGATSLVFSEKNVPTDTSSYEIAVMAEAKENTEWDSSSYGDTVTATNGGFKSSVRYEKNTIYWDYDVSAAYYTVSVNGTMATVSSGNSMEITLNQAGNNEIVVTAYGESGSLGQAEIDVYAYTVTLDPNGATFEDGTATSSTIYVAQGDTLNLGEVVKDHADFLGWYTQADYTDGQSDVYEGKGSGVASGSVFTGSRDMYLYAYWSYEYIEVELVIGNGALWDGTTGSITMPIKYNSTSSALPVPTPNIAMEDFLGWFVDETGDGKQYTDGLGMWTTSAFTGETRLYAFYLTIFSYTASSYGGETVYAVSVSSRVNINRFTNITIPAHYDVNGKEYNLVLNTDAFSNCPTLVTINVPDTIRYISVTNGGYGTGTGAFSGCSALENVNVYTTEFTDEILYFSADGVLFRKLEEEEDVELLYYPYARALTSYEIPSAVSNERETNNNEDIVTHSVTTISAQVFRDRKISSVTIPTTVTKIENQAFYNNTYLGSVFFEAGGTASLTIEDNAFLNCTSLSEITLPSRCGDFNGGAFEGCTSLGSVYVEAGGTYSSTSDGVLLSADGTTLVYYPTGRSGDITITQISGGISKIGENAFAANKALTSAEIPAAITEVGEGAFEGCSGLTSVTFMGGDSSANLVIKTRAFYGCTRITEIVLPTNLVTLEDNAFGGCYSLTYVYYDSGIRGTNGTTISFADGAFGTTNYILTLELGKNVPTLAIGDVFDGGRIQKIIIDSENTNYVVDEDYSVVYNAGGTSVLYCPHTISGAYAVLDSTQEISATAFSGRTSLTSITLGQNVTTITDGAFSGCTSLTAVNVDENNTVYASVDGVLYSKVNGDPTELLYVPVKAQAELTVPETVKSTKSYAFQSNTTVTTVTFQATDTFTLGTYTFYGVTTLVTVNLPNCVTEITEGAFSGCTSLLGDLSTGGTMTLPSSLKTVGVNAFYGCTKFATTIPAGVTEIKENAFYNCWKSTSAQAPITFASVQTSSEGAEEVEDLHAETYDAEETTLTIGDKAFYQATYATAVVIPNNVVSMGEYAFYQFGQSVSSPVPTIEFEEGCQLTELSAYLFQSANKVETLTIPESVTKLGTYCFASMSKLTSIEIPAGVTEIGDRVFSSCSGLTAVTFAEGSQLTTIGNYAFNSASKLTAIKIPENVNSLGTNVFSSCSSLTGVTFEGTQITSIPNYTFSSCRVLEKIELPSGITGIGNSVFSGCWKLSDVTIPDGVTSIGTSAFLVCNSLATITIPASVKTIGNSAFYRCHNLTSVTFAEESCLESVGDKCFAACEKLASFSFPETTASSISLGSNIFGIMTKAEASDVDEDDPDYEEGPFTVTLTSLYLSAAVTSIGNALGDCAGIGSITVSDENQSYGTDETGTILYSKDQGTIVRICGEPTSINIPNGVTTISAYAFGYQPALTEITIPGTVQTIGNYAFQYCTALTTVTFENGNYASGTNYLGTYVFDNCTALTSVTLPNTLAKISEGTFSYCSSLATLSVPSSVTTVGDYAFSHAGVTSLDFSGVTTLGGYALWYCQSLTSVKFTTALQSLGEYSFSYCSALTSLVLPEGLTEISTYCFQRCTGLADVAFPSTLKTIGNGAFSNCTALTEVVVPEGVTKIDSFAFANSSGIERIELPSSLETIGTYAFEVTGISSISIPYGITSIPNSMCYGCASLTDVYIPDTVTYIGTYAFQACTALKEIYLGAGIEELDTGVFYQCSALESVGFGSNLKTMAYRTFSGCSKLKSIELPATVTQIGEQAFYNCSSLTSVKMETGVTTIYSNAFYHCTSLEYLIIPSTVTTTGSSLFSGCTCNVYIQDSPYKVADEWNSGWISSFNGTAYFYSVYEPAFNSDGTGYDEDYWYYGDDGMPAVWEFDYTTYTVVDGGYVLFAENTGIVYVCMEDARTGSYVVYTVAECVAEGTEGTYSVALTNGSSYTVTVTGDTATITEAQS